MLSKRDPIIALATAPGKAGIGVVRVSGENLGWLLNAISSAPLVPRVAKLITIKDSNDQNIDSGLGLYFKGPHSFTGEDVFEFQGHGGNVVLQMVLHRILELGSAHRLRIANPGEFSERAFLNNKIDLAQAEAISDLIEASTQEAVKSANRSLVGEFSRKVNAIVENLTHLRLLVEATLDFPEEEIEFLENAKAQEQWEKIHLALLQLLKSSKQGALLRQGAQIVLAGAPNVGKSSLLNQLAGQDIAIVTPIAGTTRDRIREHIQIDGIPIQIVDTAGLRETTDEVEQIGVRRSWDAIKSADLVIFMGDASNVDDPETKALYAEVSSAYSENNVNTNTILEVWNKVDQVPDVKNNSGIYISAKTGFGMVELREAILQAIGWEHQSEHTILARQRHIDALNKALNNVLQAQQYLHQGNATLELFAEELRLAQENLGEITGKLLPDDLLGKIFSSFCIGK